jgi:hypothetical protein
MGCFSLWDQIEPDLLVQITLSYLMCLYQGWPTWGPRAIFGPPGPLEWPLKNFYRPRQKNCDVD